MEPCSLQGLMVYLSRALFSITGVVAAEARRSRNEILSKPLCEGWSEALEQVLGVEELAGLNAFDAERFHQAAEFYRQMLGMNYGTIGTLAAALRRHDVPVVMVRVAAATAYLHKTVAEAITEGYSVTPLKLPAKS